METQTQEQNARTHTQTDSPVEMREVHKSFGDLHVLKGIDLSVQRGETVVIIGTSGAGKSVILKCLAGLMWHDAGTIRVLGEDMEALSPDGLEQLRKRIGFLFQGGALYDSMSVSENMEFGLERIQNIHGDELNARVKEGLEMVGLSDAIDKMPSELSGGMRKRLAVARMIVLKPELALYDEPTTGLDPVTSDEISHVIRELQEKFRITSVIVTHDIPCAHTTADRVLVLQEGRFVANGSIDELQHSENAFVRAFFATRNNIENQHEA